MLGSTEIHQKEIYDAYSNYKLKNPNNWIYPLQQVAFDHRVNCAMNFVNSDSFVLDLGCGDGIITNRIAKKAKHVIGVDISPLSIQYAKCYSSSYNVEYYVESIERFINNYISSGNHKKFDVILLFEVLEHLENPVLILSLINKILKNEGILVLSTPDFEGSLSGLKKKAHMHEREYTRREVFKMLQEYSFNIISFQGLMLYRTAKFDSYTFKMIRLLRKIGFNFIATLFFKLIYFIQNINYIFGKIFGSIFHPNFMYIAGKHSC